MAGSWEDFIKGVPSRLAIVPIDAYRYSVEFVKFAPDADTIQMISNQITEAAINTVAGHPDLNLSALHQVASTEWLYSLSFNHPLYDFQINIADNQLMLGKVSCSLEELFMTMPLIESIARQILGKDSRASLRQHRFFDWIYRAGHAFSFRLQIGPKLSDSAESNTNLEIANWFTNLSAEGESIRSILQPDSVLRADASFSMKKELVGRDRTLYIIFQAPWNIIQRDIDLSVSLRVGDTPGDKTGVTESDFNEFGRILPEFYRDVILMRIMREIFKDTTVVGRL
ncbi:hypothetical protein ACIA5A_13185 [Micromonospora sp. NPDC051300]|uniref:hypothetical protein n=1 Tax=Micromonospora sp. NPDC051300 TaxID=3364286 RepID=UPI0037AD8CF3